MTYEFHIGVDYHKAYSHIVVEDSGGKTLRSGRVRNDSQAVASFLQPFSANTHAVLEVTRNWTVMFDWLESACVLYIAPPIRSVPASARNDDASHVLDVAKNHRCGLNGNEDNT